MQRRTRIRVVPALTATLLCVAAVGCAGNSTGSKSPGTGSAAVGSANALSTAVAGLVPLTDVASAVSYVGGKAGPADKTLKPITVGFIDQNGGSPSFPEQSVAAAAAVEYINNDLGGIAGHPLALSSCTVSTAEEQGQTCGQQFLNNPSVMALTSGGFSVGNQSLYQTLGGQVPFINGNISLPVDASAANSITLDSGILGVGGGLAAYLTTYLKPKTVAIIHPDSAQPSAAAKNTAEILRQAGITVKDVSFPADSTDLLAPLIAGGAKDADVVLPFVFTPNCAAVAKTLTEIGRTKPVVGLGLCVDPSVSNALGDYPNWSYFFPSENPYFPQGSPQVTAFLSAMHKYAGADANIAGYAGFTFSSLMTTTRILNSIGPDKVSRASISAKIKGWSGPGFMLPDAKCGTIKGLSAACTLSGYIYTYKSGIWSDPTAGKGITPR